MELSLNAGGYHSAAKTDANVKTRREKEGRCGECGAQTHNKVARKNPFRLGFDKTPLDIPGEVHRGRCLRCKPLPSSHEENNEGIWTIQNANSKEEESKRTEKEEILSPDPVDEPKVTMEVKIKTEGWRRAPRKVTDSDGATMVTYFMINGDQYGIQLKNHGPVRVQALLRIDGNDVGKFRLDPGVSYVPIERPIFAKMNFTFYTVRAVRSAQFAVANPQDEAQVTAGMKAVAKSGIQRETTRDDDLNGLVECVVTPVCAVSVCVSSSSKKKQFVVAFHPKDSVLQLLHKCLGVQVATIGYNSPLPLLMSIFDSGKGNDVLSSKQFASKAEMAEMTLGGLGLMENSRIRLDLLDAEGCFSLGKQLLVRGCAIKYSSIQGATTLQGRSEQTFQTCDASNLDQTKSITLYARLVGHDEARPNYRPEPTWSLKSACPPPAPV